MVEPKRNKERKLVAQAIKDAWDAQGETPFPLYAHEAESLATAAIDALDKARAEKVR